MGDNGDPKDWPAAEPKPPSLAGAYSDNMLTVIVTLWPTKTGFTLTRIQPWLSNYVLFDEQRLIRRLKARSNELVQRDWHLGPAPTEIDWLAVSLAPPVPMLVHGKPGLQERPRVSICTLRSP